ncbi:tRNA (adenosine(37)-N6)-dimethylallyltransferase MiaA [Patescibacteria group bacterium]|nr:tRNA (adenosine(37)-N6)-dimethylallyltransferase MiaA [Patescibacteria group bacterium]MBU1922005.1 tRNA (adenosine(37)-N6)-dimethylallyltransferase MiaA [Patescibacteria group bacterium]
MNKSHNKLVVILGPTGCGKTRISLDLAKEFNGEIVGADSRQIYKWMNIGTDKMAGKWKRVAGRRVYEADKVAHYLVDFLEPNKDFSLAEFQRRAVRRIKDIQARGKLPFLVGGTGLYIKAVVDNMKIPRVKANQHLRDSLETKPNEDLWNLLSRLDPGALKVVDPQNKRRIIRALEVCILTGKPFSTQRRLGDPIFNALQIGLRVPREELDQRVDKRVDKMVEDGLLEEVKSLLKRGFYWDDPGLTGIGYRQIGHYLQGSMNLEQAIRLLKRDTRRYARRQMTWFKRDDRINWIENNNLAFSSVEDFLRKH